MSASSSHDSGLPLSFEQVLADERRALQKHPDEALSALCLSGGGVRSASFCLGALQALSRAGVLGTFDYLSTVSGGGYVGGWLSAWRLRAQQKKEPDPCQQLVEATVAMPEPPPLARLRAYIKYLTPYTGVLSADVWTLIGTMVRNLLVNWMLLVPAIAAAAMLPRLYLGVLGLTSQPELVSRETLQAWYHWDWLLISIFAAIASMYAALQLPSLGRRPYGLRGFLGWYLTPILIAHVLFSVHRFWAAQFGDTSPLGPQVIFSAVWMVLPWILGGAIAGRVWHPSIWVAAAASGAAGRLIAWKVHAIATTMATVNPAAFVVLDLTAMLMMLFLQIALFIGLASREMTDEDREWWARTGAWILICALAWGAISTVVIAGPIALNAAVRQFGMTSASGHVGLGLVAFAAGLAQRVGAVRAIVLAGSQRLGTLIAMLAAPLVTVCLFVLASDGNAGLLDFIHSRRWIPDVTHPAGASLPEDLIGFAGLALLVLVLGHVIAVNRFSLHGMYRFRLVRTFLGASRSGAERHPSPFTGFDEHDDLPISELSALPRPLHVVNATLNTVEDTRLATADTKARSFTFTAQHSGAARLGYRPSAEYAGGVTLGDALTTSGAAVNSNMGAEVSRLQTFLLTVFNARLGVWLGNPGAPGDRTWKRPIPSFGVGPLLSELLGRTTDDSAYVNLSDGGHFDNLGVYEMIRRRCRTIVAIDAGADPAYAYSDLANLIRRARIDFGVPIVFPRGLKIGPTSGSAPGFRWAVGDILYRATDAAAENGVLLYIKPTILGDEPVDVANYAQAHPPFPHQSTTNQWFASAEFESYRALGFHTIASLCGNRTFTSPRELYDAAAPLGSQTS